MATLKDMTGKKCGNWSVLYRANNTQNGQAQWVCRCICGKIKTLTGAVLRNGSSLSCGCTFTSKKYNTFELSMEYGIGYDNQGREFYFDKDDYDYIKNFYWRVHNHKYVSTAIYDKNTKRVSEVQLHNFLMNPLPNQEVDHINHNPLDNRKQNLRVVSIAQNQMNAVISTRNTSGVKGVDWDKKTNKWRSRISVNGKRISLGLFDTFELAKKARKDAETKYYGKYRYNANQESL